MEFKELQRNWDAFGRTDPLWAIKTTGDARGNKWELDEFWETGRKTVGQYVAEGRRLGLPARQERALDFGCGVGRLTRALARHFDTAVGVDVAASMIDLARDYLDDGEPVEYVLNEREDLSVFDDDSFDFILTVIVLQHMEPRYAAKYMAEFVRILRPGGLAVFQIPASVREMRRLPPEAYQAEIEVLEAELDDSGAGRLRLGITHAGTEPWTEDQAIFAGNHWRALDDGTMLVVDDGRAELPVPMDPGQRVETDLHIMVPDPSREYVLEVDLVADEIGWFEDFGSTVVRLPVTDEDDESADDRPADEARAGDDRGVEETEIPPVMEVYGTPREDVEQIVTEAGGRVLQAVEDNATGRSWLSYTYYVTKD